MNTTQSDSLQASVETAQPRGMARRNFVRGVGVMIPAVLTVTSRSAMATVNVCLSPSASASINLTNSRPDRTDGDCVHGRTPGYWQNASTTHPTEWIQSGAKGTLFSTCFLSGFPGKTLKKVMNMDGTEDPQQLGAHLSAAWCNLQMGWVTVVTLEQLQAMWAGQDNYSPMAGVVWTREDTVTYLKTTMWQ